MEEEETKEEERGEKWKCKRKKDQDQEESCCSRNCQVDRTVSICSVKNQLNNSFIISSLLEWNNRSSFGFNFASSFVSCNFICHIAGGQWSHHPSFHLVLSLLWSPLSFSGQLNCFAASPHLLPSFRPRLPCFQQERQEKGDVIPRRITLYTFLLFSPAFSVITHFWLSSHCFQSSWTLEKELPIERNALISFFRGLGGSQWKSRKNWLNASISICDWEFVSCNILNASFSTVVALTPEENNLSGSISGAINDLVNLRVFWLRDSLISGVLPSFSNLTSLEDLRITDSKISTLPPDLCVARNLQVLQLIRNQIVDQIPDCFCNFSKLRDCDLVSVNLCVSANCSLSFMLVLFFLFYRTQTVCTERSLVVFLPFNLLKRSGCSTTN